MEAETSVPGTPNQPISPDRALPFVDAVFRIIDGSGTHDAAVALLEDAETRHGLHIVDSPDDALSGGPYQPVDDPPPSLSEVLPLVSAWSPFQRHYTPALPQVEQTMLQGHLFPFIAETGFLIQGMDFSNDHFIVFATGLLVSWTQRGWGGVMAAWATSVEWRPRYSKRGDRYSWKYTDFYGGASLFERYGAWAETVREVIRRTWERQLATSVGKP
jgi:hypothetical protein